MLLSIVIPCYNEEQVLPESIKRIEHVVSLLQNVAKTATESKEGKPCYERLARLNFQGGEAVETELVFVNDGSSDKTLEILLQHQAHNPNIRVVNFARNFGHQIAVTAGMDAANGDAVVLMDCDLQDPPEVVLKMFTLWLEGYDVVYATRTKRPGETRFKKATATLFYRVLNLLSDTKIPLDTGDFRLMDRKVVDALDAMPERDRFIRGMVSWVGFKQISLPYERAERFAGTSKYPLTKMLSFALTGILSFSTKPLKLASLLGIFSSFIAVLGLVYALYAKFFTREAISGWTSLILSVLFIGGVQLFCTGILGEYIGRIYNHVKERPLYIVEGYYGYDKSSPKLVRSPVNHVES
ncbi:MAG: glycosyltransferase family 2 protein [Sutterella sp.]|nr:glycosyltransferase family 2 protein [Sutterella sp.]